MGKNFAFIVSAFLPLAMNAQTLRLTDMTLEQFMDGGANGFSFQKYTSADGFSDFAVCSDSSTVNYVDVYQVEHVGGRLICEIDGVVNNGELTWASNTRTAWHDSLFVNVRNDSKSRFVYVGFDPREGYGFELNGNDEKTAAINFTAPEDGCYRFSGSVIRQDIGEGFGSLDIVPLFRFGKDLGTVLETGLDFPYTSTAGTRPDWDGTSSSLAGGGGCRYLDQEPTAFTFAMNLRKGDIVSFVEDTRNVPLNSAWARDFQARSFMQSLDAEKVDASEAAGEDLFVDPYRTVDFGALIDYIDELEQDIIGMEVGTDFGQVSRESVDAFYAVVEQIRQDHENGRINSLNEATYYEKVRAAYDAVVASEVRMDLGCEGNYVLWNGVKGDDGSITVTGDAELMSHNEDAPWGFYRHSNNGTYTRLTAHDSSNQSKEVAWYKGSNDWFYITDNGAFHPMTSDAPTVVFKAPEDGIYNVIYNVVRPNPNPKVENPLYVRNFFHKGGLQTVEYKTGDVNNDIYAVEYGSVANDGMGGMAPVDGNFYVYMKAGDVVTTEIDCYTTNRNSSAGTQFNKFFIISRINEEEPITAKMAAESGKLFFNLYEAGDPTRLTNAIYDAVTIMDEIGEENIGHESGKYDETLYQTLLGLLEEASAAIDAAEAGDPTWDQSSLDALAGKIQAAASSLKESRYPFEKVIVGEFRVNTTDGKHFAQTNMSTSTHYYAAMKNEADLQAYCDKNAMEYSDLNFNFLFADNGESGTTISGTDGFVTRDGYVETNGSAPDSFRFWTVNEDDENFAIQRMADNLYWKSTFTWKSPYDKVDTNAKADYCFQLESVSPDCIESADNGIRTVVSTRYYSLDGREVSGSARGVVISRQLLENGMTISRKTLLR
ncbi:MAG: hypothetical protein MJY59_00720 [Bacteroidaceae bacterium]|nr:hypothetical protein [Bacteroidaceae bacterium]